MTKIGINGFGRIGRAAFKIAFERGDVEVVAINDLGELDNLAYLLRYDSVYGRYAQEVKIEEGALIVNGKRIQVLSEKDPAQLPWGELGVEVVIESTGVFTEAEGARKHLAGGAKHVVISAPTKSDDLPTAVIGVNDAVVSGSDVISNASCTTNCVAPVVAVLDAAFGIEKALLMTAHAYTASQELVDGPARGDFRRGRAAAVNMVPSSTGAAIAATKAYPALEDKFDGVAVRVPIPVVSLSDITLVTSRAVTVEEISEAFRQAAGQDQYRGVLAVTDEPTVSSDFIGDPHSATVDLGMTRVVGGDLVKILAWYDNEWGYSNRLVEQVVSLTQA